jgi:hypothetical protein
MSCYPTQHVLVVEDIVDTGRSITRLLDALKGGLRWDYCHGDPCLEAAFPIYAAPAVVLANQPFNGVEHF